MTAGPAQPAPADPVASPGAAAGRVPLSVLVLTKNEEVNIAGCLAALGFSDDIVVLDSFSTDRTVEIASAHPGVRVLQRPFDDEFNQRSFGLHGVEYRHPWVYVCDADERPTPALVEEFRALLARERGPGDPVAYRMRFKNMFLGKWLRHSTGYPVWVIRLMRPDKVRYEQRATNIHPICDGPVGELHEHFLHYSFNAGLRRWFDKHNYYSSREALEAARLRSSARPSLRGLLARDPMARRRAAKNLSFFIPGRASVRFVHDTLVRMGFLDGVTGVRFCAMIAMYEYWIELKIREIERPWNDRTDALVDAALAPLAPLMPAPPARGTPDAQPRATVPS